MELTGKTTKESTKVDGNLRIAYEVVHEDAALTWVRVRVQDITTLSDVGVAYYNANMGGMHLNYSHADALTSQQRHDITVEFINLVNSELDTVISE